MKILTESIKRLRNTFRKGLVDALLLVQPKTDDQIKVLGHAYLDGGNTGHPDLAARAFLPGALGTQ